MPIYSVQGPDGRIYDVEGPAGASEADVIAAVKQQISAQQPPAPKETTFGGQTKEFFKGLVPGAIGLTEQAGIGISALLPDAQEKAAQQFIKEKAAAAKAPFAAAPGYEDTVGRKLGEATGSTIPFLAAGPLGAAGRVAGYGLGIGAGAGQQVEKSAAEGATEGQQTAATALGAVVGATEMFAPTRILKRIGEPAAEGAVAFIKRALAAGGEEAAQEAASQAAQNLISKGIYKPEQEIVEQVGESAAYGGAVGGLTQGLLDLAIGRRAPKAATTQQEEYKRLRAEEADRLAKEREYKQTPDYAQEVSAKYLAAEQQRKDLLAQVKKINKDSPTVSADRAFNSDINAQVKELTKSTIDPLKNEFNRVQPILKQLAEKERVAKLTPQEYAFGIEPEQAAPQAQAEPRMYYDQEVAPATKPETEPDKVAQHAAESVVLANEQRLTAEKFDPKNTTPAVSDYVEYLMRDPALAEQVVQNRVKLPGLPTGLKNADVLDALKLQTEPLRKAREKAELEPFTTEMSTRTEALKPGKEAPMEDRTVNAMKEWQDMMDDPRKEVGDRYFDYLDPLFNKAVEGRPRAIEVSDLVMPSKRAAEEKAKLNKALADKAQADAEYIAAKRAGEQAAAKAAFERGNTVQEQLDTMAKDSAPHVRATLDARKAQEEALTRIEESLDRVRRGETLGKDKMATGTAKSLAERAEKARGDYIAATLLEAAIARRAQAKPAITTDEAVKAASELHDALTEWVTRAQAAPRRESLTEVVTQPAQMRGTQVVRGAETEMRDVRPLEQRRFGAYDKAVQVVKEQLEQIRDNLGNPTVTPTRVEGLKMQFASTEAKKVAEAKGETATTLAGELRRRTEFVRNLMSKRPLSPLLKDTRDALNRAADVMDSGKASRSLLDAVEYVATNLAEGRRVLPQDVRAINDALQVGQQVAASVEGAPKQGQLGLEFEAPGEKKRPIAADLGLIRASARNFINSPPVREARAALDRAKELQALEKKQSAEKAKVDAARREQRITELEGMISDARGDYQTEVYRAFNEAKQAAVAARNEVLDPQIKATSDALKKASKRFDAVSAEIEKNTKRFEDVLAQKEGKDRTQLATYELLKLEERRSIAEDTKKEIEDAQAALAKLIEQRTENFDGKEFAAQAILDGNVRIERDYLTRLEERMAKLQDNPNPAQAAERATMQQELAAQREAVRKAEEFTRKEREQSQKEVEALMRQREGLGLPGLRRTEGRLTPILSKEEQAMADRRDEALRALRESEERTERMEVRKARIGVAMDELTAAQEAGDTKRVNLLKQEILALQEGRKRKQRAATRTVTTGPKELRTGSPERFKLRASERKALAQASEALRAEREGGIYGEGYEAPDLRGLFDDFEFSRGKPVKGLTKAELTKELDKAFGEKGLLDFTRKDPYGNKETKVVTLYENLNEYLGTLEPATRNFNKGQIPSDAKGFVQDGKAVLFANNIAKGEGLGVLLHEVGVHIGFRNFFNAGQYNALVKTVKNWANKTDDSMEARVGKAAMRRVEAAETPANQIDDELLAYAVEEAMQMGVSPAGVKGGSALKNWLKMVLDGFKKALEKFGISAKNLTAGDLVNFAYGAANLELRGTWHGSDAKFTAFDTKYVGEGEGAYDRRFDGDNSLGAGPYVTPYKEYGEYYQQSVPFGKAANKSGYGRYSYQDYAESLANETYKADTDRSTAEIQRVFESNLLHRYLNSLPNGGNLDPTKNTAAVSYIPELKKRADSIKADAKNTLASRQKRKARADSIEQAEKQLAYALRFEKAANTLDLSKIKGLTARPTEGNLYRTLDDIPRENVFNINSEATMGDRPKIDAIFKKYGTDSQIRNAEEDGTYRMNSLYYSMRDKLGVEKANAILKDAGIEALEQRNDRKYIERAYLDKVPEILGTNLEPVGQLQTGEMLFSRRAVYANPQLEEASKNVDKIVAREKSWWEKIKANATGLAFETQVVDRFAGFERLAKYMEPLKGTQMLYYLRMYDQRMNFTAQSLANGAPTVREITRPDGQIERLIESAEGPNIGNVVNILKNAPAGNGEAVNRLFTLYMAAARAKNKGLASLNFSEEVTQEMLDDTVAAIEATPGLADNFKQAKDEYNAYNRSLIDFLVQTGAINKKVADRLVQENDYIPFYRERGGVAELVIGSETPIRIGSIAEQPYLHELIGGDKPILDFLTSSVQNTNMLVDMGMRNLATKNAVYELVDLGAAKFVKSAAGPDVVKFREDGDERYAVVASEKVRIGNKEFDTGVPADLLVKGMEGIPTQMPVLLRAMAVPSMLLRKAITLSPVYMGKQLFRDSLAAPILSGANFTPVLGALREIGSATKETLERRGIVGGQQFTGTMDDRSKILRDMMGNKTGWMQALGKMEALGMEADALTRRAQYNSYIEQGLSEMEATMMSLEAMNFNKRGASPSIHAANALIPFFNAQIQGLNVLYKALSGKMPFNDQLKIREKLLQRGSVMMVASLAYAAAMQDDDAYKNATPDQKYANWFVRVPGLDEPIRVPIPFEIGYIFKALPEALYNSMVNEHGGEEAVQAFKQILLQTAPGGSSYGVPQALKPAIEAGLGKSFYTGRDILSRREKELLPEEQYRANTTEAAKMAGQLFGISPVVFEQLVSGYTGTMGLALLHAVSVGVPKSEAPDQAVKRLSDMPVVGSVFQPNDAGGVINNVYDRMLEDLKVKQTVDKMFEEGRINEAQALLQRRGNEYLEAELAGQFKSDMSKLTQAERAINASTMSPEEKRAQLTEIRKLKILVANTTREIADKTIHLSSPF